MRAASKDGAAHEGRAGPVRRRRRSGRRHADLRHQAPTCPYADSHPEAVDGFDGKRDAEPLTVVFPPELEALIPESKRAGLRQALACGPIPGYQHDPTRRYGFNFSGLDVRFRIQDRILTVVEIVPL